MATWTLLVWNLFCCWCVRVDYEEDALEPCNFPEVDLANNQSIFEYASDAIKEDDNNLTVLRCLEQRLGVRNVDGETLLVPAVQYENLEACQYLGFVRIVIFHSSGSYST